jgi:hypothetical protein
MTEIKMNDKMFLRKTKIYIVGIMSFNWSRFTRPKSCFCTQELQGDAMQNKIETG